MVLSDKETERPNPTKELVYGKENENLYEVFETSEEKGGRDGTFRKETCG